MIRRCTRTLVVEDDPSIARLLQLEREHRAIVAWLRLRLRCHGGTILVEREPGHGATFTVRLPLAEAAVSAARD